MKSIRKISILPALLALASNTIDVTVQGVSLYGYVDSQFIPQNRLTSSGRLVR